MSLRVEGYPYYAEFDYYDLYDAIYEYYGDIDRIYDWLESPHARRGDIKIELTSPHGTTSVLLPYRNYDFVNDEGYDDWPFMSVHFWGENPIGTWTLKITYISYSGYVSMSGLSMTLYGTATVPTAVSNIPTSCDPSCARGCSGSGPFACDSCQNYRVASTLECVEQCPNNTHANKTYCYPDKSSPNDDGDNTDNTDDSDKTRGAHHSGDNKVPLIVAMCIVGVLVAIIVTIVIITGITYTVYKRKRTTRSARFIRMVNTTEET